MQLGSLHMTAGDSTAATACYERAIRIAQENGYKELKVVWLGSLGRGVAGRQRTETG